MIEEPRLAEETKDSPAALSFNYHDLKSLKEKFQVFENIKKERDGHLPKSQKNSPLIKMELIKVRKVSSILKKDATKGYESEIGKTNSTNWCYKVEEGSNDSEDERFTAA